MQFGAILGREGYVGEDVVLTLVDQGGKLGPARPQLIGGLGIGLQECLADRGSDHLSFGTRARAFLTQCTWHLCQVAPSC